MLKEIFAMVFSGRSMGKSVAHCPYCNKPARSQEDYFKCVEQCRAARKKGGFWYWLKRGYI